MSGRTTSSIDLSWVNGSAPDLQAVAVRRKAGSVAPASLDEGRALSLAGFATSITDTGLRPHTTYSYSVFMVDFGQRKQTGEWSPARPPRPWRSPLVWRTPALW